MAYNFKSLKDEISAISEWLTKEFSSIRTGRATPKILDSVSVESYGSRMNISQVASISIEDARALRIKAYDDSQTKNIEKAIIQSNLGLSVAVDDRGLRVVFPELTTERRDSYVRLAKEKLEESKKKLRTVRDDVWKDIQTQEKDKKIGEDEKFRLKNEMQKLVDDATKTLEALFDKKDKEIHS